MASAAQRLKMRYEGKLKNARAAVIRAGDVGSQLGAAAAGAAAAGVASGMGLDIKVGDAELPLGQLLVGAVGAKMAKSKTTRSAALGMAAGAVAIMAQEYTLNWMSDGEEPDEGTDEPAAAAAK